MSSATMAAFPESNSFTLPTLTGFGTERIITISVWHSNGFIALQNNVGVLHGAVSDHDGLSALRCRPQI